MRGSLVVFEGGEGVGKTTQWRRLVHDLSASGVDVLGVREPGGTLAGNAVRQLLLDPAQRIGARAEALLFAASRAQLIEEQIRPALERGALVLVDRFLLSTYVYQGAGRGLPMHHLRAINAFATGGLVPDLTLLLTLPLAEARRRAAERGDLDRMEQEDDDFHRRVSLGFAEALTPGWQAAHPECGPILAVDAGEPEDVVTRRVQEVLAATWPEPFRARTGIMQEPQ